MFRHLSSYSVLLLVQKIQKKDHVKVNIIALKLQYIVELGFR